MLKHMFMIVLFLATIANASNLTASISAFLQNPNNRQNVHRRQSGSPTTIPLSEFPTQCQPLCEPAIISLNACNTNSCFCSLAADTSLVECLQCSVNVVQTADAEASANNLVNAYYQQCSGARVSSISTASPTSIANPTSSGKLSGKTSSATLSQTSISVLTISGTGMSTASIPTTSRSAGTAMTSANIAYLSSTVVVTLLIALVA